MAAELNEIEKQLVQQCQQLFALENKKIAEERAAELVEEKRLVREAEKKLEANNNVCSILDLPDEILVMIILYLNARERVALANSCQRFNDLVFGNKELLRNLDFTDERQLTKKSDIQKYFDDENIYKKILRINIENVRGVENLSSSIGKALNLVELNVVYGLKFESVKEMSCFLKPLVRLKRLSVSWPDSGSDEPERNQVLKEPFSRLTYLFLNRLKYSDKFLLTLQHCQQLEKLALRAETVPRYVTPLPQEFMKLNNLKFVQLDVLGNPELLKNDIMSIVPDPTEWIDFYTLNSFHRIYLERNVEVCAELERGKKMPLPPYIAYRRRPGSIETGWSLFPEHLLSQVIRVTHEDAPEEFCCLSWSRDSYFGNPYLLKTDEAKKLLKDPEYQISSLRFTHRIEKNCDVHLLATAFPNLTKFSLNMISNSDSLKKTKTLRRRLRKKGSLVSEEHSDAWNTDSSFKMLVENTPRLKVLEILPDRWEEELPDWDWDAFHLISGWKNLTIIRLYYVPMRDARFLIDIGKECKKLEEVMLHYVSPSEPCCYEIAVLEMLVHCVAV